MKIITHEDIINLNISYKDCYKWVEEAIKNKDSNDIVLPPKISLKPNKDGEFCNVMPSVIKNISRGGVKIVTRYLDRKPSLNSKILLFDSSTGSELALMDGNWITAFRTAGVAVHSISLFAKKNFKTIAIMGLGNMMYATFEVLLAVFPNREFTIKILKYKNQHNEFADRFKNKNLKFEFYDNADEWAKGSDVIISAATYLAEDICKNESFDEGVLLVPIHTRGFTNCDLFFDKIYGDDKGHIQGFKYFNKYKYFAEVSDVVNAKCEGRKNDKERIIAYNIGISLHDIYFASKVYELFKDSSKNIDFKEPIQKLWV